MAHTCVSGCTFCHEVGRRENRIRTFPSGAIRDTEQNKFDYEGCLSPVVVRRFAAYMHKCCKLPDGSARTADNWQKGIPRDVYIKSMFRHFMDLWLMHRGGIGNLQETLCALLFNVQGYLFEVLKEDEND